MFDVDVCTHLSQSSYNATDFIVCLANILGSLLEEYGKSLNVPKALFGYYEGYDELKLC